MFTTVFQYQTFFDAHAYVNASRACRNTYKFLFPIFSRPCGWWEWGTWRDRQATRSWTVHTHTHTHTCTQTHIQLHSSLNFEKNLFRCTLSQLFDFDGDQEMVNVSYTLQLIITTNHYSITTINSQLLFSNLSAHHVGHLRQPNTFTFCTRILLSQLYYPRC
jgi:hypothetical protein